MKITELTTLSKDQKHQVDDLIKQVKEFDQTYREPYLSNQFNYFPEMPTFFLALENQNLVGFMMLYADEEPDESVDVNIYVLPDKRRQGIGTKLLEAGKKVLHEYGYHDFNFYTEKSFLEKNPDFLTNTKLEIKEEDSEFQMCKTTADKFTIDSNLSVRILQESDLKTVIPMYCEAFDDVSIREAEQYLSEGIKSSTTLNYLLENEGVPAGLCSVDVGDKSYYLFGLLISQKYRNQGLGSKFIKEVMQILTARKALPFVIGVEQNNSAAYHVYQKVGFTTQTEIYNLKCKKR
ncbi:GNAT family N-acetyltransferase [Xylocopilactobacillus apis]|uniref:Acetyltransferase n=1 Tax=Xylocopilactobacillus apis TaxID=2932183 RepID=A0AAU9DQJ3_9LACO|nr:GNAT family N-acetyltransferase [Xylocopilactobacillus apis]BDR55863.1 acetyltransferase [Xylocopilactobacillus apis]